MSLKNLINFLLEFKKIDYFKFYICYVVKAKQSKAKQSKANDQRPHQHFHSIHGNMVRVPRYRVYGRHLCCSGFAPLPDVVLDDHVVPV